MLFSRLLRDGRLSLFNEVQGRRKASAWKRQLEMIVFPAQGSEGGEVEETFQDLDMKLTGSSSVSQKSRSITVTTRPGISGVPR